MFDILGTHLPNDITFHYLMVLVFYFSVALSASAFWSGGMLNYLFLGLTLYLRMATRLIYFVSVYS